MPGTVPPAMRSFLVRFRVMRWLSRRWYRHQRSTPPRTPSGWVTGPPDFIGVGAQKAGTTWWYDLIATHPDVSHHARPKELHYFDDYWDKPVDAHAVAEYARYFPRPPGKQAGEWTPGYMAMFWAPAALRTAAPDARLLVMLRDPVERYQSGLSLAASSSRVRLPAMRAREAFRRGFYAEQLEALYEHFPRDQVLVLQYEKCKRDATPYLTQTFDFLGLDPSHGPGDIERTRNPAFGERVAMPDEIRAPLVDAYASDVKRLVALAPGIDLALWPNFSHLA
jgi:Sulfotransferase domain